MKLPKPYAQIFSTSIKIIIVLVAAIYICRKALTPEFHKLLEWPETGAGFWILLLVLTALNWMLEAWKWKYLVSSLEPVGWGRAIGAVLAGITMGIATPNRTGEFLGRIFSLEKTNRADGFFLAAAGSFFQLLVTLLCGALGFLLLRFERETHLVKNDFPILVYGILVFGLIGIILLFLFSSGFRKSVFRLPVLKKYTAKEELYSNLQQKYYTPVFAFSLARYLVFATQFVLLLYAYGLQADLLTAFAAVAVTYLVVTVIPSFAFTDVVVRGSAAVAIIGHYSGNERGALIASLVLWVVNVALPALAGIYFVWRLRFLKPVADER